MTTYRFFSFRINNIAYKNVVPYLIEINKERVNPFINFFNLILNIKRKERYVITFVYKDQNADHKKDNIFFDDKEDAEYWYTFVFDAVFLEKNLTAMPPKKSTPPPKPKPKLKPLEKLNKPDHLKVVKDNDAKEESEK